VVDAVDMTSPRLTVRTLLIDNYDSFTYNLFHYLAEINGREPVVVRNDDPEFRLDRLDEFDNVVLSPGPGSPDRPADFGICADVIRSARIPILGVCLGHQGLAVAYGGAVGRAPEPRHGRTSPVRHDGTGLFAGLPSPVEVVRYHSLAVTEVPPALEAIAWSPDGVVMALRHRRLPRWGVQFHPESIGTQSGHVLLRNFARLTREWHAGAGRVRSTPAQQAPEPAKPVAVRRLRVVTDQVVTGADPEVVFDRMFRAGEHPYWLDSGGLGDFSIMGDASGPLARIATANVARGTVTVAGREGTTVVRQSFFDWLDHDLRSRVVDTPELPGEFALGWVGYLGYELKVECGAAAAHRADTPDATLVFADRALVFDHRTGTVHLLALAEDGSEGAARGWLRDTRARLLELAAARPGPAPPPPALPPDRLRSRHDRRGYLERIESCQEEIRAGESYEVCLTNMLSATVDLDRWQAYRVLRRTSPAPFGAFLDFGDVAVLSTSPERFLRVGRDGVMESRPIKGTRPRGRSRAEDALLAADLATSEKDHAENLMIVDLVRHDLGRCARVGSVVADPLFRVETYAAAHQLVSTVRAELRPDRGAVDGVRAAFPPGSMTGAPKVRTMAIIDRLEAGPRGVYSGAIGYFSLRGGADFSVVIRTVVLRGRRLSYGVGGAIIGLSDPAEEFEETAVKATPLLTLLGTEFPGRAPVPMMSP
jgi:para-aminobenzoate synthetase